MPHVELDLVNYANDPDLSDLIRSWITGTNIHFDFEVFEASSGIPWSIELHGTREDLITVINRYETDLGLVPDLIADIRGDQTPNELCTHRCKQGKHCGGCGCEGCGYTD